MSAAAGMTAPNGQDEFAGPVDGLESQTRRKVLAAIKRAGVLTVAETMEAVDLSKTAVRAHLLRLEALGLVERTTAAASGRGRPALAFRATARSNNLFPTSDGAALTELLAFLHTKGQTSLVEAFFQTLWTRRKQEYSAELGRRSRARSPLKRTRLTVLHDVMERNAFMPDIEDTARETRVTVSHCPFPSAVAATRQPCKLEAEFLSEVIGEPLRSVRYASGSETRCTFRFGTREP